MKRVSLILVSALSLSAASCSDNDSAGSDPTPSAVQDGDSSGSTAEEPVTYASLTGDPVKGKSVFMQCRTCHVMDAGQNRVGPSLHNIVGAKAGAVSGFNYSPANANSGITWTEEKLFEYLADPQAVVPKTKMIYGGMPDAQQRADVIAYMKNPG